MRLSPLPLRLSSGDEAEGCCYKGEEQRYTCPKDVEHTKLVTLEESSLVYYVRGGCQRLKRGSRVR